MITLHRIVGDIGTVGFSIIVDDAEDMRSFQTLIQRGANLWPDAPPSIKAFADEVTSGKVLQDYSKQDTSVKSVKTCVHKWIKNPMEDTQTCVKCQLSSNY